MSIVVPPSLEERAQRAKDRSLEKLRKADSLELEKKRLGDRLDTVEWHMNELRSLLIERAQLCSSEEVQALVERIRIDERELREICVHRLDHNDPEVSVQHDLANNERSLSLVEELALAVQVGIHPARVVYLHRLQRDICRRLKELGIETSQN